MPDHIHPLNWVTHPLRRKAYTLYMPDRMPDLLQDGSHAELAGSKACLACSWALEGRDEWNDEWMDKWTENLSILQNFVPYRGCCPATAQLRPENCVKRGKGTADHMMPLGDWLTPS